LKIKSWHSSVYEVAPIFKNFISKNLSLFSPNIPTYGTTYAQ